MHTENNKVVQKVIISIKTIKGNIEEVVTTEGYATIQEARDLLNKYEVKELPNEVVNELVERG